MGNLQFGFIYVLTFYKSLKTCQMKTTVYILNNKENKTKPNNFCICFCSLDQKYIELMWPRGLLLIDFIFPESISLNPSVNESSIAGPKYEFHSRKQVKNNSVTHLVFGWCQEGFCHLL